MELQKEADKLFSNLTKLLEHFGLVTLALGNAFLF